MLSEFLEKKVIKTETALEEEISMQRYINPIVKHTYQSLPRIYGHQTKKRYLSKSKLNNTASDKNSIIRHKCWNMKMLQQQKQLQKIKLQREKSATRFDSNKTVKRNKQQAVSEMQLKQQKRGKHQRTKSLKFCNVEHQNKLSKPKQYKCNKRYCVCKSLYGEYCQEVKKIFIKNSLDSKVRKNQTYNVKRLPKLSGKSQSCLDDRESMHKVSNAKINTQNIQPNGYSSGLLQLIKRREEALKIKKQQQMRDMRDQQIQTVTEQQNEATIQMQVPIQTEDKYVNTDLEDIIIENKKIDIIQINKADAQNQTQQEEQQKQQTKIKHIKKQPMAHLSQIKSKYKTKKPYIVNRYCINQHVQSRQDQYTQSQKQKQEYPQQNQIIHQNNSRLRTQPQKQYSVRSSTISQISLSKYILKGMSNQNTIFSLLNRKQQQSEANNKQLKQKKKNIKLTSDQGLFTIPEEDQYLDYLKSYKPISKNFKIKNLVRSEYFKIIIDKQGLFFGQYKDQEKNGKGLHVTQRQIFQGTYHKNIKMDGCERNIDGTYIGQFLNGKRHGKGKFLWHNGQVFEGQWKLGTKNGLGVWKSPKGDSYQGQWLMNRQHGKGIFKHKNSVYQGEFQNFLKSGSGKQKFANGDKYIGEYQDGKPHGIGKYFWKNGSIYEGQFVKGLRQGYGKWHESDQITYEGEFSNDFKHGKGTELYKNGDVYQGAFVQGIKTRGIYKKASDGQQIAIETQ